MSLTSQEITRLIQLVDFDSVLGGLPLRWDQTIDKRKTFNVLVHCCCNGPVGVQKRTSFNTGSGVEEMKIADLWSDSVKVTNSNWKELCRLLALWLDTNRPELQCATKRAHSGKFFPLYED
jgi:hypothetical protein